MARRKQAGYRYGTSELRFQYGAELLLFKLQYSKHKMEVIYFEARFPEKIGAFKIIVWYIPNF